jgi:hypothetical protein
MMKLEDQKAFIAKKEKQTRLMEEQKKDVMVKKENYRQL